MKPWIKGWWWRALLEPVCWLKGHDMRVADDGKCVTLLECERCAIYKEKHE